MPMKLAGISKVLKKYRIPLLLLLLGVLLLLLPKRDRPTEVSVPTETEEFSLAETEARMEVLLSAMEGVGRVKLMLTVSGGTELELARDENMQEKSGSEIRQEQETVTINRGSGQQEVVVTARRYPAYQGAVVVCDGADSAAVRLQITEAVAVLTGLPSHQIRVIKWNES